MKSFLYFCSAMVRKIIKKILIMKRFTLSLLALLACIVSFAETVKIGDLYYSLGNTTATVVQDQSSDKSVYPAYISVTVPASVTYNEYTYPVTTIGASAFEGCSNLQSVTLPATLTKISTYAFYGCVKLSNVNLHEGLTSIEQGAFYNCNLSSVTIPSTMTSIGSGAFKANPLTTVVWLPANCSIGTGDNAPFFSSSSKITSFTFGDQVETIPSYLCKNMSLLDTVVLPPHQPAGDAEDAAYKFLGRLFLAGVYRTADYVNDHQYGCFLRLF